MVCLRKVLGSNLDECIIVSCTYAQYTNMYIMGNDVKMFFLQKLKTKTPHKLHIGQFCPI
jgi:hypothetical protein